MNVKPLVSHTPMVILLAPRHVCQLFMTDNDAEITLLEIASAQPLENPQSGKRSVVWPAAFLALLCMWGQGGRRQRERACSLLVMA